MSNKNTQVTVSGITPVASDEGWFAIDKSGTFSIDRNINATVYLVGGGCYGEAGTWNEGTQTATGGKGGDGGYVYAVSNVKIMKNIACDTIIAEAGDKSGTMLEIGDVLLSCDQSGYTSTTGGSGSKITGTLENGQYGYTDKKEPEDGTLGVPTPYQVVGSSGGGAMSCTGHNLRTGQGNGGTGAGKGGGHQEKGNNATNHGCGGGGGDGCGAVAKGNDGGEGMKGCIIVVYTIEEQPPTLIVQKHYRRVCNTRKTCNTDYYSNNSHKSCCGCGGSKSANAADYTDAIHISSGKVK